MQIKVLKGTNEIGGTCIEIKNADTNLFLDVGLPLDPDSKPTNVEELKPDAVLISHSHPDHYGLLEQISPEIPVHIGLLGQKLIEASRVFLDKKSLINNFVNFEAWKPFSIGSMTVTPYLVDHSAPDAYAFLIEGDGKKIFYSGDFRAHGRKAKVFDRFIENPPSDIDLLLMEGTMLERSNDDFPDEASVETRIMEVLKDEPGPCFLLSSSQNIDRLVSAYRASKRAGRIFVVDIYTAWILKELSQFFDTTPTIDWKDIRVLAKGRTAGRHYQKIKENPEYFEGFVRDLYKEGSVITHQDLSNNPQKYFIKSNYVEWLIKDIDCDSASVIYSMWRGYLSEEHNPRGYKRLQDLRGKPKINFSYVHTSGHATVEDLKQFANALSPGMLVPIHTEHKDNFLSYFKDVKILDDGQQITLIGKAN